MSVIVVGAVSASACGATAPTSIYVAVNGNDANSGTAAAPVITFERAYQLARPGQTVRVTAGDYPYQRLVADGAKRGTAKVFFKPAVGATVNVSLIDFGQGQFGVLGPHDVKVQDMNVTYLRAWAGTRAVTWENIHGQHFDVFDAVDLRVVGGVYGPCQAPRDDPACVSRIAGTATGIIVDGVTIQGVTSTDLANYHVDGLMIRGCTSCTVRNSRFLRNMITNIRVQNQACCINQNLTIENNWFGPALQGNNSSTRFDGIDVDDPVPGLLVRMNSFAPGTGLQLIGSYSDARVVGNLLSNATCAAGVRYAYNVYVPFSPYTGQAPCGRTEKKVRALEYANPAQFDYHVTARSPGFRLVPSAYCARSDIDGHKRFRGFNCDAGADEQPKALLCHRVKPNHPRHVTIAVIRSRLAAYLKHGDALGRCRPSTASRKP
jgi:hypothetical protein